MHTWVHREYFMLFHKHAYICLAVKWAKKWNLHVSCLWKDHTSVFASFSSLNTITECMFFFFQICFFYSSRLLLVSFQTSGLHYYWSVLQLCGNAVQVRFEKWTSQKLKPCGVGVYCEGLHNPSKVCSLIFFPYRDEWKQMAAGKGRQQHIQKSKLRQSGLQNC